MMTVQYRQGSANRAREGSGNGAGTRSGGSGDNGSSGGGTFAGARPYQQLPKLLGPVRPFPGFGPSGLMPADRGPTSGPGQKRHGPAQVPMPIPGHIGGRLVLQSGWTTPPAYPITGAGGARPPPHPPHDDEVVDFLRAPSGLSPRSATGMIARGFGNLSLATGTTTTAGPSTIASPATTTASAASAATTAATTTTGGASCPSYEFRPMRSVDPNAADTGILLSGTPAPEHMFSVNYRGERSQRNCSAAVTDNENTSLWITKLPPGVTYTMLLGAIHNAGRVYATMINEADPDKGHHTAAAKLVFFTRAAALLFYIRSQTIPFVVGGCETKVSWNRIKSVEQADAGRRSRVLLITGHRDFVNRDSLTEWFEDRLNFQIDDVRVVGSFEDQNLVEYRFGSYRCQAESARMALSREHPAEVSNVEWGEDPCACQPETGAPEAGSH